MAAVRQTTLRGARARRARTGEGTRGIAEEDDGRRGQSPAGLRGGHDMDKCQAERSDDPARYGIDEGSTGGYSTPTLYPPASMTYRAKSDMVTVPPMLTPLFDHTAVEQNIRSTAYPM